MSDTLSSATSRRTDQRAETIKALQDGDPFICLLIEGDPGDGDHTVRWAGPESLTDERVGKFLESALVGHQATSKAPA